jgi:hypothetical protein
VVAAALALAAIALAVAGCGGGPQADRLPWVADFATGDDGAAFSNPEGSDTGNCSREVRDGAAVYTWRSDEGADGFTRCYPVEHFSRKSGGEWRDPVEGAWVMTGRFRVALPDPEGLRGETFSLITILPSAPVDTDAGPDRWLSSTTVNVVWDQALGEPLLNLFHVPSQGQGDFERVRPQPFLFGRWVTIRVEWDADNAIRVFQDGRLVLRARKASVPDAGGGEVPLGAAQLHAVHFGGYASEAVTGWTIENDDLEIRPG